MHVLDRWGYFGSVAGGDLEGARRLATAASPVFDRDVYQILKGQLAKAQQAFVALN